MDQRTDCRKCDSKGPTPHFPFSHGCLNMPNNVLGLELDVSRARKSCAWSISENAGGDSQDGGQCSCNCRPLCGGLRWVKLEWRRLVFSSAEMKLLRKHWLKPKNRLVYGHVENLSKIWSIRRCRVIKGWSSYIPYR